MKIVPLDKDGKYLIESFLEMVPHYETSRRLYTLLHHQAMKTGNPKFSETKKVSKKIKRLFLDIYKRICVKLSKKNAQKIFLSSEMEERISIVIRHYNSLNTKDIFIRICYRYVGNKEKGQVTESEEMQFYEEVNKKIFRDGNLKKEMVDFEKNDWHEDDSSDEKKVKLFANGQFEEQEEVDEQKDAKKKDKNWDKQIEKQIQKVESEIVKAKKQRQQQQKIEQQQHEKVTRVTRSKKQQQNPKKQQTKNQSESDGEQSSSSSSSLQNSQSSSKKQNQKTIKQEKSKITQEEDNKKIKQQKDQTQNRKSEDTQKRQNQESIKKKQAKKSQTYTKQQKRKIVKAKAPKDNTPLELKDDKDIWTLPTFRSLCQQYLKQQNCLINLASQFSNKHKIYPVISVKDLSQRLVQILVHGFKIFVKISKQEYRKKFQISQISDCDEQYLQKFFRSSKGASVRRKLIRIYLKNNDDDFELKQREAYEIFLIMKEGLIELIENQDEQLCDQDELAELLQSGKLTIEQEQSTVNEKPKAQKTKNKQKKQKSQQKAKQSSKRSANKNSVQQQVVRFKAGPSGKKIKK